MKRNKALLTLFVALTLCGSLIAAEDRPEEEKETGAVKRDDTLERQNKNETEGGGGFWGNRNPCTCRDTGCKCCTRTLFPFPPLLRQRACMNLTYQEQQSGLNMTITLNRRVLFNNSVSGRNPEPVCVSPPLFPRAELCAQLHDVYVKKRNMHACLKIEGHFNDRVLFGRTMGCMFVGANGFAILRPDADGEVEPGDEDEDEVDEGEGNDNPQMESGNADPAGLETDGDGSESTQPVEAETGAAGSGTVEAAETAKPTGTDTKKTEKKNEIVGV